MENREWDDAFAPLRPSAGLKYKVMNLDRQEKKVGTGRRAVIRVAAVAALLVLVLTVSFWPSKDGLVTAPGVLKVYAYDQTNATGMGEELRYELVEGSVTSWRNWHITSNVICGLPLVLSAPEEKFVGKEITFDVTVAGGEFVNSDNGKMEYWGQHITAKNNQTIYWSFTEFFKTYNSGVLDNLTQEELDKLKPEEHFEVFLGGTTYIDIIIYADNDVVGCMVVKICPDNNAYAPGSSEYAGCWYHAEFLQSVSFPDVDGQRQNVTEGAARKLMENWRMEDMLGAVLMPEVNIPN